MHKVNFLKTIASTAMVHTG